MALLALLLSAQATAQETFRHNDTIVAETKAETKARLKREWRDKYRPFVYPDGSRWAAPFPVAWCESGGNYFVGPYGAYGLILEQPWLPPKRQDEIAYRYLHTVGAYQAWERWETGCAYR